MFGRARRRLTLLYIALFAIVLGVFSTVFYVGFATILAPEFDIGPELSNEQAADAAYQATLGRVGGALVVAYVVVVALVGVAAWLLASRTLRPIREAHARQRRFVADASHEIRTPLAAIRAMADDATDRERSPDELLTALAGIGVSAERLSRLTNDLLLLARSDEHAVDRRSEPIDLSVLTAEALEEFIGAHPETPRPQLTLATDLVVSADPDEVRRIVLNLLDNAVRYGGREAHLRVSTRRTDGEEIVDVSDAGPGIAEADLERIFDPFYRVRADAGTPDGSGLGLAIARSLAERNGGRLTVISQVGSGATFRLALPRFR
ncbi:MAG: HAMP domain-containing sensor histidine kinase [Chloroflexota bacterium]